MERLTIDGVKLSIRSIWKVYSFLCVQGKVFLTPIEQWNH